MPVSVFTSLQVDSVVSYLVALLLPAFDAIFPVVPSETVVIALGVATAGSTDPRIALLVACAAAGAFVGDNLCYLLGRRFGPATARRFFAGGRTGVALPCGVVGYPRRTFAAATAVAAVIWALYAFFIGRIGGRAFEDNIWAGLAVAFGASV